MHCSWWQQLALGRRSLVGADDEVMPPGRSACAWCWESREQRVFGEEADEPLARSKKRARSSERMD